MLNAEIALGSSVIATLVFAGGLALVATIWYMFRKSKTGSGLLSRYVWIDTAVNFALIPMTIFAFGRLATKTFEAFENTTLAEASVAVTQLALFVTVTVGLGRIIEVWITVTHADDDNDNDGHLPQLARLLLYGVCVLGALAVFLTINGFRPTELYLSTGVIAAIAAFASQQTLGDFFAGLTLSLESPFKLGDWLVLEDGTEGRVVDINWRTTRLRQWDNATLVVPNSVLAKTRIRNLHDRHHTYSPWYTIRISAEHDPRAVKVLLLEAALRCKRQKPGTVPSIRLTDMSQSPYSYMIWVHFANYQSMFAGREELFREIHDSLNAAGIQVAVDIQEVRYTRATRSQMEPTSILMALKSLDFASFLTDENLADIAAMSKRSFFESGSVILDEGEHSDSIYIVSNGVVTVNVCTHADKWRSVEELKPGQYFGLAAMLTCEPAAMQFSALTDVSIIRIDVDCLRKVVAGQENITEQFAELVQRRKQRADESRAVGQDSNQAVTFQDLVRRVDRAFRTGVR